MSWYILLCASQNSSYIGLAEHLLSSRDYERVSEQFPKKRIGEKRNFLTVDTGVVGFHKGLLDLAVLHQQSVPLAAVVAEDGRAVEAQVQGLGELAGRVTQEAHLAIMLAEYPPASRFLDMITYTALASRVEGSRPSLSPIEYTRSALYSREFVRWENLHKGVIDGDHKDLAGLLQLGVVHVARDVGAGASGASKKLVGMSYSCRDEGDRTESRRGANDDTLALDLLGEVDFVAGRVLDEVKVGDGVALLHEGGRRRVEGPRTGNLSRKSTSGKHGCNWGWGRWRKTREGQERRTWSSGYFYFVMGNGCRRSPFAHPPSIDTLSPTHSGTTFNYLDMLRIY